MESNRRTYLFYRHFDGTATPEEQLELAEILQGIEHEALIQQLMEEAWQTFKSSRKVFSEADSRQLLENILKRSDIPVHDSLPLEEDGERLFIWKRISIAVSVLLVLGIGLYYFKSYSIMEPVAEVAAVPATDIQPGGNKALLTLSDGKTIILDHALDGVLTRQGNVSVVKTGEGKLAYEVNTQEKRQGAGFNTLKTPRGGQYHLVLPDGSRVWLNAASSIRYPTVFDGDQRKVEINGEAYFEINTVYNPAKAVPEKIPFVVTVNEVSVEVLGTHFNINAYRDEGKIQTTLLEGSVRIHHGDKKSLLKPGQQASIPEKSASIQIRNVDASRSIAWKNGFFQFEKADLAEIMRQLTKWYDVDVKYEGKVPDRKFSGEIPRSATLSQVLEILEISKVHLDIAGKEVIVKP